MKKNTLMTNQGCTLQEMLSSNLLPYAIGLNDDIVVPSVKETTYFLSGCICLYFQGNVSFKAGQTASFRHAY